MHQATPVALWCTTAWQCQRTRSMQPAFCPLPALLMQLGQELRAGNRGLLEGLGPQGLRSRPGTAGHMRVLCTFCTRTPCMLLHAVQHGTVTGTAQSTCVVAFCQTGSLPAARHTQAFMLLSTPEYLAHTDVGSCCALHSQPTHTHTHSYTYMHTSISRASYLELRCAGCHHQLRPPTR
jgi:hypothetical protein